MSAYSEKLKDPRWQKKRLGILERDKWRCVVCDDADKTLHVHHKRYSPGEPWDIPDHALVTLCADCHQDESDYLKETTDALLSVIKERFYSEEIHAFTKSIAEMYCPSDYGQHYLPTLVYAFDCECTAGVGPDAKEVSGAEPESRQPPSSD